MIRLLCLPLVFILGLLYLYLSKLPEIPHALYPDSGVRTPEHEVTVPRRPYEQRMLLSREAPEYQTDVFFLCGKTEGPVALLLGGAHGNEPGGYLTLLEFLSDVIVEKGTLVVVPLQNPVAFSSNNRSTRGPVLNNYYNFGRGFPASRPSKERDRYILAQLVGHNHSWWWYEGDEKLIESHTFPGAYRKATEVEGLLDEDGYRLALDPQIKMAAGNIYRLMLGMFPDGSHRYEQIDVFIDLHEAAYFFDDRICTDDPASRQVLEELVPKINSSLAQRGLDPITTCFAPIPTSSAWTAAHDLPRPALSFTTETNYTRQIAYRIRTQRVFLDAILKQTGLEISYRKKL